MAEKPPIQDLLERLAGQAAPLTEDLPKEVFEVFKDGKTGLGYSQLNELLLLFGFDRITHAFFRFLIDGSAEYKAGDAFLSFEQLEAGVRRFRETALLLYGNVKFAFKSLSRDADVLESALRGLERIPDELFAARHDPIYPIDPIPADDAYLTGYLIEAELLERLNRDPQDQVAKQLSAKREAVLKQATRNQQAYLVSDHLDVYVATSMRERHEFMSISRLATAIFEHELLKPLKLRWFDPTQAYCHKRIDKGLSEALMLRRATCTIYLAQESDTLGKDSELASTLAQGKPVVAYIPTVDQHYFDLHLKDLSASDPSRDVCPLMLGQLRIFEPAAAWHDKEVIDWCRDPSSIDAAALRTRLIKKMAEHYDKRAKTLREDHPLGIQVNLVTGVANGVLVVRNIPDCAQLIRRIVTHTLEMELEEHDRYTALREKLSNCVFRVMTRDAMLTNTFWNFYLDPAE